MDFSGLHFIGIIVIIVMVIKSIGANNKKKTKQTVLPARIQHYKFAHKELKDIFFNDRDYFVNHLLNVEDNLRELWYDVGKHYFKQYEGVEKLDGSDISVVTKEYDDKLFSVIQLPKPMKSPEAYFIGLIIPYNKSDKARYITLERGENADASMRTVLCEWTHERHINYGDSKEPTIEVFKDILIELGDVSVKTWAEATPTYSGDNWMITLWEWADTYNISPLILPRNSKALQELESLLLNFSGLKIDNLPEEIGNLVNLKTFALQGSNLEILPHSFRNLINLKALYIDRNSLKIFPDELCGLINLERLFIGGNQLESLPECIGNLKHLVVLNMYGNQVKELPLSMSELTQLEELAILGNPIKRISVENMNLPKLKDLNS